MANFITRTSKEISSGTSATAAIEGFVHGFSHQVSVIIIVGAVAIITLNIIENRYENTRKRNVRNYGLIRIL